MKTDTEISLKNEKTNDNKENENEIKNKIKTENKSESRQDIKNENKNDIILKINDDINGNKESEIYALDAFIQILPYRYLKVAIHYVHIYKDAPFSVLLIFYTSIIVVGTRNFSIFFFFCFIFFEYMFLLSL